MKFTDADLRDKELLAFLGEQESVDVDWGTKFREEFLDEMQNGSVVQGDRLPWSEYDDKIGFAPGEITVHTGLNGHRKSMVVNQMMGWFALRGARVGVMSFEMPIRHTMKRLCLQMAGTRNPTQQFVEQWLAWNHERICYYDKRDTTPAVRVMAAASHMGQNLGCRHIVIDSLMKCGLPYGEGSAVKEFIDVLTDTARAFNFHIHLVAHARKPEKGGDDYIPNRYDVLGASEITNLAHNCVIHWANTRKEKILQSGKTPTAEDQKHLDKPCQLFIVDKQRNGAWKGIIGLTHHESMQLHRGKVLKPRIEP